MLLVTVTATCAAGRMCLVNSSLSWSLAAVTVTATCDCGPAETAVSAGLRLQSQVASIGHLWALAVTAGL